ncbi:ATP-binding protein [Pleomorphomonas sp. JP5]|uniref:ATP-binding protein n=1 Tax=Pleomorphomonas sp. JP5 TaxID=2942998 RepID=UPI00204416C2|nr:ATP-binding protein [Pleomorphomonas sp. JP5]MCM5558137.1 ATP-binding protein [Pleomorphomonas sp. JP5]
MKVRLFPRSLAGQLSVLLIAAVLIAQVVTLVFFAESRRSAIDAAAREQVLGRIATLANLIEDTPAGQRDRILGALSTSRLSYSITQEPLVRDAVAAWPDDETRAKLDEIFGPGRQVRAEFADGETTDIGAGMPMRGNGLGQGARQRGKRWPPTLALSVLLSDGKWLNSETLLPRPQLWAWPVVMSTFLTVIAISLVVALSVRRITKPLREMAQASDRLGRGESVPDLPERGPEEIVRANRAFNAMQARVSRFVADRTRMVAAISHDLRTPLTSLRLRAEFIDDDETRERMVDTIDEMTHMAEATLAFARDDAAGEASRNTDLLALVEAVSADFSDLGQDVSVEGPEHLYLSVRPVSLRRALRNLVENALRYGLRARVRLERTATGVIIAVDDDGPGIPEDKMEEVFAPFTRLETSRNLETGGVGLGLATARSIVRAHGGELTLANRPGGGLTAAIHLPVAAET